MAQPTKDELLQINSLIRSLENVLKHSDLKTALLALIHCLTQVVNEAPNNTQVYESVCRTLRKGLVDYETAQGNMPEIAHEQETGDEPK